jgi:hypothetical protein
MIRHTMILLGALTLALPMGCRTEAEVRSPFGSTQGQRAELAAYAASQEYPADAEASDELRAAALVDRRANTIKIVNFSDQPIRDADVWVNGNFLHRVPSVPPNGSVTVHRNQFYDARGQNLAGVQTAATRVQIASGDELYNLLGPVFE